MRPAALALALGLAVVLTAGPAWGQGRPNWRTAFDNHQAPGGCAEVQELLEFELKAPTSRALLAAGRFSQWGHCLERNPEHAWTYYERAYAAGATVAALHLAGLASTRTGGADVAAVLWWARRIPEKKAAVIRNCDPFPDRDDVTEGEFLEALRSWPQERLLRCRNDVGYRALVVGEMDYPLSSRGLPPTGAVVLRYDLHRATVAVVPAASENESDGRTPELIGYVKGVAQRTIDEMPPSPMPQEGEIAFSFVLR